MNTKYPLDVRHRSEWQWAERFKGLIGQIVAATGRTLQRAFDNEGSLIPIPVRVAVDRRRLDRSPPR